VVSDQAVRRLRAARSCRPDAGQDRRHRRPSPARRPLAGPGLPGVWKFVRLRRHRSATQRYCQRLTTQAVPARRPPVPVNVG